MKHDVSRLPVVEKGRIVGIIDRHDILKGLILRQ
ncbi:MAG TPA: CBS domain-containing protein [Methanomicrobiales archaeon]|nr:CBS domain-containing protein [Methanomicrobiales archaeon]